MNICKERINNRTKSLREKFIRNRSYSELSFKDVPSTTTTTTSTNNDNVDFKSNQNNNNNKDKEIINSLKSPFHLLSKKTLLSLSSSAITTSTTSTSITKTLKTFPLKSTTTTSSNIQQQTTTRAPIIEYQHLQDESYGSALDLNLGTSADSPIIDLSIDRLNTTGRIFSWQHDVAIQCDLLSAPKLLCNQTMTKNDEKKLTKKNLSISHSATTALINVAAAKLRNITDHHSYGDGLNQSSTLLTTSTSTLTPPITNDNNNAGGGGGNCVSRFWKSTMSVTFHQQQQQQQQQQNNNIPCTLSAVALNGKKSTTFGWTASVRNKKQQRHTPILKRAASFNNNCGNGEYSRLVQSTSSPSSPELTTNDDIKNEIESKLIRPTTYDNKSSSNVNNKNNRKKISSAPDSFDESITMDDDDYNNNTDIMILSSTSENQDNKKLMMINKENINNNDDNTNNNNNNQKKHKRKNKNLSKSFKHHDDYYYNYYNNNYNDGGRKKFNSNNGDNDELYNFDTKNRLLNISLEASSQNEQKMALKSFLLDLPKTELNNSLLTVSNRSSNPYLNLPSPNIQSDIQDVNPVLRKLSVLSKQPNEQQQQQQNKEQKNQSIDNKQRKKSKKLNKNDENNVDDDDYLYDYDENELMTPDEQPTEEQLKKRRRRRALVPPKLITDVPSIEDDYSDGDDDVIDDDDDEVINDDNVIDDVKKSIDNNEINIDNKHDKISTRNSLPTFNVEITGCNSDHQTSIINNDESIVNDDDLNLNKSSSKIIENDDDNQNKSPTPIDGDNNNNNISSQSSSSSNNLLGFNLNNSQSSSTSMATNRRRSSIVVIPPMQICPGDLLVYSKVLTQRANMIAEGGISGSSGGGTGNFASSLLNDHDNNRKSHKNTWSLLRLCVQFDRSGSRSKTDQILCGLEEFLSNLPPSNLFFDETMLRYRAISWYEFQSRLEKRRQSNDSTTSTLNASMINAVSSIGHQIPQQHHSKFIDNSRHSSLQSNALETIAIDCPSCHRQQNNIPTVLQQHLQQQTIVDSNTKTNENYAKYEVAKFCQRTESVSTEQEVESIVDFEIADNNEQQQQQQQQQSQTSINKQTNINNNNNNYSYYQDIYGPGPPPEPSQFCRDCFQNYKREKRRREALWELFQSELLFLVDNLMVLKNVFMEPLKNIQVEGYAMFAEPEVLFGNLDELCLVTYTFCKEFLNLLIQQQSSGMGINVTNILNKLYLKNNNRTISSAQAYHRYTLNYINALQYLETLRRQLEFIEFEKWCNRDPRCKKLQLTDLLVTPVQHVMRIPLLLKEIENKTYQTNEKRIIQSIIIQQEHSLRELDDKMRWLKNFERLLEIQRNILWPSILDSDSKVFVPEFLKNILQKQPCERLIVSPRRQIILEGPLMIMDSGKPIEMYVFLFDDLLLITRRKKGLGKKQSTLTERWVSNCSGRSSSYSSGTGVSNPSATIVTTNSITVGNNAVTTVTGTGSSSTTMQAGVGAIVTSASVGGHVTSGSIVGGTSMHHGSSSGHHVITTTTVNAGSITHTGVISLHGEPHHGPLTGGSSSISGGSGGSGSSNAAFLKYVVYKQPLSLDRFYIHEVPDSSGSGSGTSGGGSSSSSSGNLKNSFVLVCLNRFQQVITVHTFQAASESAKNTWLSKLRSTCDRWKRTLQNTNVIRAQQQQQQQRKKEQHRKQSSSNSNSNEQNLRKEKIDSESIFTSPIMSSKQQQHPKNKRITEMQNHHHQQHHHKKLLKNSSLSSLINENQPILIPEICPNNNNNNNNNENLNKCTSIDSINSVEPSVSYQIDDSQLTATTFT